MQKFKIRCSAIGKIMGRIGPTDKQLETLKKLRLKPKLTDKQKETLEDLEYKNNNPKLPETCTSYLKEWYADQMYNDSSELYTKEIEKGKIVEIDAINMIEKMEGEPFLIKNEDSFENEFMTGTPDSLGHDTIYDSKCSWNGKTFLKSILGPLNPDYEWQMRGYLYLCNYDKAKVCYCLLNTPEEINYGVEVNYNGIDCGWRYKAFTVFREHAKELEIEKRVRLCRKWLDEYDKKVKTGIGVKN